MDEFYLRSRKPEKLEALIFERHSDKNYDHLLDEVKPIIYTLQALGRFPYQMKSTGLLPYQLMSFSSIFCLIFYLVQLVWTIIAFIEVSQVLLEKAKGYDGILICVSTVLILSLNVIVPFTYWWESPKLVKYLLDWKKFQEDYKMYTKKTLKLRKKKFIFWMSVFNIPFALTFAGVEGLLFFNVQWYNIVPYMTCFSACNASFLFWILICFEIKHISKNLEHRLIMGLQSFRIEEIKYSRLLWVELSDLTRDLGSAMGQSILSSSIMMVTAVVFSLYGILCSFHDGGFGDFFAVYASILPIASGYIIALLDTAHTTANRVGNDVVKEILRIVIQPRDYTRQQELSLMLQVIAVHPPLISVNGFITVNRSSFVALISSCLTYLIILLQFKTNNTEPKD